KSVAPMPRSGVLLKFNSSRVEGALIQLRLSDGSPVPLGAEVVVNDLASIFHAALRGEVFVTSISFPARLEAKWPDHDCIAVIPGKPSNEPLPKIGPITCEAQK